MSTMQTTKQPSRRRVSSRLDPLPLPTTDVPVLLPSHQNAFTKTPERPIAPSRGSSSGSSSSSMGHASTLSSNSSSPMSSESPITSMESTPNHSSPELIFSKEMTSRTIPNELASLAASLQNDLEELSLGDDRPTTDTPLRKPAQRRRISRTSSPAAVEAAALRSRPRLQRHFNLDSAPKQQLDTKPKIPGGYESQNNDMRAERASDDDDGLVAYTSTRITDGESEEADSLKPAEAAESDHDKLVPEKISLELKDTRAINTSIYKCLNKESKATKNRRKPGWIYIFESPGIAPGHVKIGKTNSNPDGRKKAWEKCGFALLELQDSHRSAFDHYSIVESLVMAELHNSRRKFTCLKHEIVHREWYEADRQSALNCIHRWRNWLISQQPLDKTSNLTPYWRWRVEKLPKFIDNVDWDRWTQPSQLDYLDYRLEQFGKGRYVQIKAHLARKDFHFCLTGGMMISILYTKFGTAAAIWGLVALLVL